jgi:AraC-like DNA-binding protein
MLARMVNLAVRPRSLALQPFIKKFHYHEMSFPFGLERILPSGGAHLMINMAEDQFRTYSGAAGECRHSSRGAVLAGPHDQPTILDTGEFQWLIAVEFTMGGAAPFFPLPLDELANQALGLDDVWGLDGCLLREQLLEAPTPLQKFTVLESALCAHFRANRDPGMDLAVKLLSNGQSVRSTGVRLGLLPRTFTRKFRDHVGLTPKRFARVRRLQRALRLLRATPTLDWCELAACFDFSDQAHFIHDFHDLTGITPTAYKPASPQRGNHVPIPRKSS